MSTLQRLCVGPFAPVADLPVSVWCKTPLAQSLHTVLRLTSGSEEQAEVLRQESKCHGARKKGRCRAANRQLRPDLPDAAGQGMPQKHAPSGRLKSELRVSTDTLVHFIFCLVIVMVVLNTFIMYRLYSLESQTSSCAFFSKTQRRSDDLHGASSGSHD